MYIKENTLRKKANKLGYRLSKNVYPFLDAALLKFLDEAIQWAKPKKTITMLEIKIVLDRHKIKS